MKTKRSKPKLSLTKRISLSIHICNLYRTGEYTIKTCCEVMGVRYSTFQHWAQPNRKNDDTFPNTFRRGFIHEVHVMYLEAARDSKVNYLNLLRETAKRGLLIKVNGFIYNEVQSLTKIDEVNNERLVEIKITERIILPDIVAIVYCLNKFS